MIDSVVINIERSTRDKVIELKKDLTYNRAILLLLKRNDIIKRALRSPRFRDYMRNEFKELFDDEEFSPLY